MREKQGNAAAEARLPASYGSWGLDSRFSSLCLIWSLNYFKVCAATESLNQRESERHRQGFCRNIDNISSSARVRFTGVSLTPVLSRKGRGMKGPKTNINS